MTLAQSASPRIAPLANLPLFHNLVGRKAVVIGKSEAADWKAELLAAAGAQVTRLGASWTEPELDGAVIVVADLGDESEAERLGAASRRAGALVNIIDQQRLSDVQFGAIVNRSPIVVAISTDGAAPALGQSIRARIEQSLPFNLSEWAEVARAWRVRVKARFGDFRDRRAFWRCFAEAAWSDPMRLPSDSEFEDLVNAAPEAKGRVTLVGAGPGDPELLTIKAVHALQSATVILYDQLVGPEVLEFARRDARPIPVGKSGHATSCKQSDINALMVELALAGEHVIRVKGGDPMIFGRAAEEIDACRAAGIEVSVIPGISAAQGAASSLLMPLTERRLARRVQFLTGHGADGKLPNDIDWTSVADRKATTILYMPRRTLREFVRLALINGLDPATPAIAVASASLSEQRHAAGGVAEIGALAEGLPAGAPVAVIIGWVARRHVAAASRVVPFRRARAS
jgi:uroporphyrin-III C-methyltransferase / precorrin-2 dehydrogenase / sirohydrochlorin ferrochelatase